MPPTPRAANKALAVALRLPGWIRCPSASQFLPGTLLVLYSILLVAYSTLTRQRRLLGGGHNPGVIAPPPHYPQIQPHSFKEAFYFLTPLRCPPSPCWHTAGGVRWRRPPPWGKGGGRGGVWHVEPPPGGGRGAHAGGYMTS